jgi:hypothetical protein
MKKLLALAALVAVTAASAQTYVQGHYRKDGTYVAPHYRSDANDTKTDNYSSKPNYNPYTGQQGTLDPYKPKVCGYTTSGRYVCQ